MNSLKITIINNFLYKFQMLYCDRIDVSEGIDINKTSASKECDIFHYWYFLDKGFKFQTYVCNGCHNVLMISINLNDHTILNINGVDYCGIINGISKSDAMNVLQNADLTEKEEYYKDKECHKNLLPYINWVKELLKF